MNNTEIKVFLEAAGTLNFTEAAGRVYLTQQAVSKYMLNLEEELGVSLFDRRAGQIQLTEAGEYYRTLFSGWAYEYQKTHSDTVLRYQMMTRRFAVGFSLWAYPYGELMAGIEAFRALRENTAFFARQYSHSQLLKALTQGELDVALILADELFLEKDYVQVPLATAPVFLYVPGSIQSSEPAPDCFGLPMLAPDMLDWGSQAAKYLLARLTAEDGLRPVSLDVCSSAKNLLSRLRDGSCVTVSDWRFSFLSGVKNVRLFPLPRSRTLYCVWSSGNENQLIPEFIRTMRHSLGDEFTGEVSAVRGLGDE